MSGVDGVWQAGARNERMIFPQTVRRLSQGKMMGEYNDNSTARTHQPQLPFYLGKSSLDIFIWPPSYRSQRGISHGRKG